MSFIVLIGLLSSVCSICSFFASIKFKSNRWLYTIFVFVTTLVCGYAVYKSSELERINNIHRQAMAISKHYDAYTIRKEFIQEVLIYLEENRDRYPEAYERAKQIYSEMKNSEYHYDEEAATELYGIIKGIATLNKD